MSDAPFDVQSFMQRGGIVVPTLCKRHEHDLVVQQLRIPPEGPWRIALLIASILLFQGATATDVVRKRADDAAALNIVLAELGCLACWNSGLYRVVLRVLGRGLDHAIAVSKGAWKSDEDFARWMAT